MPGKKDEIIVLTEKLTFQQDFIILFLQNTTCPSEVLQKDGITKSLKTFFFNLMWNHGEKSVLEKIMDLQSKPKY